MAPLLQIEGCTKRFGGLVANRDVSLAIEAREIVGLIGPNGAGKTTLFNCISGALHPDEGRIVLDGTDISHARPEQVCRLGIARTWQVVRSFGRMTVLENVICGALRRTNWIGPARARALELLAFTGLAGKEDVMAAALTLADKKRLEITRALATSPACSCSTKPCRAHAVRDHRRGGAGAPHPRRDGPRHLRGGARDGSGDAALAPRGRAGPRREAHRGAAGRGGPRRARHHRLPGGSLPCQNLAQPLRRAA